MNLNINSNSEFSVYGSSSSQCIRRDTQSILFCHIFKIFFQVNILAKYLEKLEGVEFLRTCSFLENTIKPYFEKSKEAQCKFTGIKPTDNHFIESGKPLLNTNSKFDTEQTLTEKLLSSVPDDYQYLTDNLLLNNNLLEEIKTNSQPKESCIDKSTSSSFPQSILEDSIKGSPYYEIALRENSPHAYLDLSKSNSKITLDLQQPKGINEISTDEDINLDSNTNIILNLCSKSKHENLKDNQSLQNDSNISEELDNLSYHISTSNLFINERFTDKNEPNTSNNDSNVLSNGKFTSNSKDDLNRILNGNMSVIHSTNPFKGDKKTVLTASEYQSSLPGVEDSISNDMPRVYLKASTLDGDFDKPVKLESHQEKIGVNCDSNTILNLKKEPECISKENLNKHFTSQDSSSSLLNLGLHSILHIFNSDKSANNYEKQENLPSEKCIKALNLVNKKYKKSAIENLENNHTMTTSTQNTVTDSSTLEEDLQCTSDVPLNVQEKDKTEITKPNVTTEPEKTSDTILSCSHCNIHFKSKVWIWLYIYFF